MWCCHCEDLSSALGSSSIDVHGMIQRHAVAHELCGRIDGPDFSLTVDKMIWCADCVAIVSRCSRHGHGDPSVMGSAGWD